jgi:RNA polymerase sigma-70 factor (ECF subfamily)
MSERDVLARETADTVARKSYGKLVAFLAAHSYDVAGAEDALSEAFASALAHWPANGIPDNPEAWLLATARRKSIDAHRRQKRNADASDHLKRMAEEIALANDNAVPDKRLQLMFACAHPAIDEAIRAPLILQTVLGFDAATIASAFLIAPSSMSQRLVRAKAKIRGAAIPFRLPEPDELRERLDAVLDAIYTAYTEGWSDPAATDTHRRELAGEAIWLGRLVCASLPGEPEASGLLALMLHCEARRDARRDRYGEFVPLTQQNIELWNSAMIDEAEAHLRRAGALNSIGRFQLEAAVQSAHAVRRISGKADWPAILKLYDALWRITGSPVVAINRAIAVAETGSPEDGLKALDHVTDIRLSQYQPYWAARAELLSRLGDVAKAQSAYGRAIGLETDPAVRRFLQKKSHALGENEGL